MRRNRRLLKKPQVNMIPMIDLVFLLLTFFVLTFRIIIPEGDFNIQMPPTGQAQHVERETDSVQVRLIAGLDGSLTAIQLGGEDMDNFDILRQHISATVLTKPDLEVVLFPDEHLRYEYVIRAITAVYGEVQEGHIRQIVSNIKFARQK